MKKNLVFIALLLMATAMPFSAHAYDFYATAPTGQRLYYTISGSNVIVTRPNNPDGYSPSGNLTIPSSVTRNNGTTYNVTSIDNQAFYNCSGLTSVTIPNSVTSIGNNAFYGCSGLTSAVCNSTQFAFLPLSYNGSYTIPYGITTICGGAFNGCSSLTSVTIPNSVTSIGNYAFYGCSSLTSAIIPSSVTSIGNSVFSGCSGLTSVTIPNSVTSIGNYAFYGCSSLTSTTIPNSVTSIGSNAFRNCNGLISVIIGNSVTSIGSYAFHVSTNSVLTVCFLGSTPPTLGDDVFNTSNYHGHRFFVPCSASSAYNSSYNSYIYNRKIGAIDSINISTVVAEPERGYIVTYTDCNNQSMELAVSNRGYYFSHWNNGSTTNPDTVTNGSIDTAYFKKIRYTVTGTAVLDVDYWSISGNNTNKWYYNSAEDIYFVSNNGTSRTYTYTTYGYNNPTSNSWLYKPIQILTDGYYTFCFDWSCAGESSDYLKVGLVPDNITLGTTWPSSARNIGTYYGHAEWKTETKRIYVPAGTYKWVFYWHNDNSGGSQPPAAVKNIASNYFIPNDSSLFYVTGSDTVDYLDSVILTAVVVDTHFYFNSWDDTNTNNPRIVVADDNKTLYATFNTQYQYTVSVASNGHGNVNGAGTYAYYSLPTITANPNTGYHFDHWSDGATTNPRTIILTSDTSLTAYFSPNSYTISVARSPYYGGTVSGGGTYPYGETATLTATPYNHYEFYRWENNVNTSYSYNNPYTVTVSEDKTYTAIFRPVQHTVIVSATPDDCGNVSGGGNYDYNSSCTITATANYGYHFSRWSDGVTDNPRTFTLTCDTSFTAIFEPNSYFISTSCNDSTMGTVSGGGFYNYNTTQILTANPAEGHHFIKWTDGDTDNPRSILIEGDSSYTAVFGIDTLTVNVTSNNMVYGNVSGGGEFVYGSPCTIEATAYSGYLFVRWSNGVTYNPYTFAVLTNMDIEATFAPEGSIHNVTVQVQPAGTGTVSGDGPYADGETATLEAVANEGWHFERWSDNNTSNPRTVVVTSDISLIAHFASDNPQGIDDSDVEGITIWSANGNIYVEGAGEETVHVFDIMGRPVGNHSLPTGVYMVKVGTYPARKVVLIR